MRLNTGDKLGSRMKLAHLYSHIYVFAGSICVCTTLSNVKVNNYNNNHTAFTANKTIFHAPATSSKQTTTTKASTENVLASKGFAHVVADMQVLYGDLRI